MPRGFLGSKRLKEFCERMKTVQVLCPDASMQTQIHSVLSEFELKGETFDTVEVAYREQKAKKGRMLAPKEHLYDLQPLFLVDQARR